MLLSLWFHFWLVILTIITSLSVLITARFDPRPVRLHRIGQSWGKNLLRLSGVRFKVTGGEHLDHGQPYIFAANHQSQFDIFVLFAALPQHFSWLAKVELFSIPLLGPAMAAMGSLPVDRGNRHAALRSLQTAANQVRAGTSIAIFPEGTRNATGQLLPFKPGGIVLAIKSGQPLVPVSISGTRFIQPRGAFFIHPGPVKVVIGTPIPTAEYSSRDKDKLMKRLADAIAANFDPDYPHGQAA